MTNKKEKKALKQNASSIANKYLVQKEFMAYKLSTEEQAKNGYKTIFISNMQVLITKLALIVSEIMEYPKLNNNNCITGIHYLTDRILGKPSLKNVLIALDINVNGNNNKHTLKALKDVDIEIITMIYNQLCDSLVTELNMPVLKNAKLNVNNVNNATTKTKTKSKPCLKDQIRENIREQYLMLSNVKTKVSLLNFTEIDKFSKQVKFKVNLACESTKKANKFVKYIIRHNNGNGRVLAEKTISLESNSNVDIPVTLKFNELNNISKIELNVDLQLVSKTTQINTTYERTYVTEGKLFKKTKVVMVPKQSKQSYYNTIDSKTIQLGGNL